VILKFASNISCCSVTDEVPKHINIDLEKKTWTDTKTRNVSMRGPYRIGQSRRSQERRSDQVIGVFDADVVQQLDSMIYVAIGAQRDTGGYD
jgi:hypothetical protein